jgi:cytochrome c oxidase subunit II
MFSGASTFSDAVDGAFLFILLISVALLIFITFLMIYFVIKYNRKRNKKAVNIEGSLPLEILWTVIPTILVLAMFWYGWYGYKKIRDVPEDAMEVQVSGQMWQWKFTYENGLVTDTLYVPVDVPVKLNLVSLDVNHSIFIPAFRVKEDVIPNRTNFTWFQATNVGSYDIACAEYCGLHHAYMYTKVVVMEGEDYSQWFVTASTEMDAGEQEEIE